MYLVIYTVAVLSEYLFSIRSNVLCILIEFIYYCIVEFYYSNIVSVIFKGNVKCESYIIFF